MNSVAIDAVFGEMALLQQIVCVAGIDYVRHDEWPDERTHDEPILGTSNEPLRYAIARLVNVPPRTRYGYQTSFGSINSIVRHAPDRNRQARAAAISTR